VPDRVAHPPLMEVLTRTQLLTRVGSRFALDKALSDGLWRRVLRGPYVPGATVDDHTTRAEVLKVLLPADTWVADRCLLWLLGVDVLPPGAEVLEAVVPRGAVIPRRRGLSVRECLVPEGDRYLLGGVRVLRPARAITDLLRMLPPRESLVVADAVLRAALVTKEELAAELLSHARLRGVRQAAGILEIANARAESPPESRVRYVLLEAGMVCAVQHDVHAEDGRWIARVDLAIPELKIAIEYDGREVHERQDVFVRDRRRQNALVEAGWVVLRFTAADMRDHGAGVVSVVAAAVRRATLRQASRTA
jgi:very-short-patch-repair endonuclease